MTDMALNNEDLINPNEFTGTELVKLIYRDLLRLRQDFDDFVKNDTTQKELSDLRARIAILEAELNLQKGIKEASERNQKKFITIGAILLTLVQTLISWLIKRA